MQMGRLIWALLAVVALGGAAQGRAIRIDFVGLRLQQQFNCFQDVLLVVGSQNPRRTAFRYDRSDSAFARLGGSWHGLWGRMVDGSADRILDLDSIMFQSAACGTVQLNFCLFVDGHRRDQVKL